MLPSQFLYPRIIHLVDNHNTIECLDLGYVRPASVHVGDRGLHGIASGELLEDVAAGLGHTVYLCERKDVWYHGIPNGIVEVVRTKVGGLSIEVTLRAMNEY